MMYIKLFEEFNNSMNESINVYPPGDPFKPESKIQWPKFVEMAEKWKKEGQSFSLTCDVDYDMYIADESFRSKAMGTWNNKSLPLFTEKYPRYQEVDFEYIDTEGSHPKHENIPWIRISDKKGVEFLIHPFHILDIQKGSSVLDGIETGFKYLIDDMKAVITDYKSKIVHVKLQDGTTREIPIAKWKRANYTEIEESKSELL